MANILGRLGDLGGLGADALLELLAAVVDALGSGVEFSGAQLERLGQLQQQLADFMRDATGEGGGDSA